jgi:hypothetical protein
MKDPLITEIFRPTTPPSALLSTQSQNLITNHHPLDLQGIGATSPSTIKSHQVYSHVLQVPQLQDMPDDQVTVTWEDCENLRDDQQNLQNIEFQFALKTPLDGIFGTTKSETSPTKQLKCRLGLPAIDVADYAQKLRDMLLDRMAAFSQEAKRKQKTIELYAAVKVSSELVTMGLESSRLEASRPKTKRGRPKKAVNSQVSIVTLAPGRTYITEDDGKSEDITLANGVEDDSEDATPMLGKKMARRINVPRNKNKVRDNIQGT